MIRYQLLGRNLQRGLRNSNHLKLHRPFFCSAIHRSMPAMIVVSAQEVLVDSTTFETLCNGFVVQHKYQTIRLTFDLECVIEFDVICLLNVIGSGFRGSQNRVLITATRNLSSSRLQLPSKEIVPRLEPPVFLVI